MLFFYLLTWKVWNGDFTSIKKKKIASYICNNKIYALKEIERGKSQIETASKYKVTKSTITNWMKKKSQIYEEVDNNKIS